MLTCDWLTLNLWQEGQPDFLHEAPLGSSSGLFFFFFFFLQNLLDIYLTYIILYLIEIHFNL